MHPEAARELFTKTPTDKQQEAPPLVPRAFTTKTIPLGAPLVIFSVTYAEPN